MNRITIRLMTMITNRQGADYGSHDRMVTASRRFGVNNATAHKEVLHNTLCKYINNRNEWHRIFWVSTHRRPKGLHIDESFHYMKKFNTDMRNFFERQHCGDIRYVDVYNMTDSLMVEYPRESKRLSFDPTHWGMEVNLIKAQILLGSIETTKKL